VLRQSVCLSRSALAVFVDGAEANVEAVDVGHELLGQKEIEKGGRKIERQRGLNVRAASRKIRIDESGLNCFRRGSADGSVRALGKRVVCGILLGAFIDFDRAFEVGAVFNHDPGGG
jgi:hypothetical protein